MPAVDQPPSSFSTHELNQLFRHLADNAHIAIAVSGGLDSMALMRLAKRWADNQAVPPQMSILTVDHGLREGSRAEAEKVADWTNRFGLRHVLLEWVGEKPQTRIQETARDARYSLMISWCKAHGAQALLTAHTIEDQGETIVMRLARGTGIEGLAGIPAHRTIDGLLCHRPLLGISRHRLRQFLVAEEQTWIDDPSNENTQFERIRVRKAWPDLEKVGITHVALHETAHRAARADHALHAITNAFIGRHVSRFETGYCEVALAEFLDLAAELRIRVLDRLIATYGSGNRAELASLERLERWFSMPESNRKRTTLGGAEIARRARLFLVGREPGRISATPVSISGEIVWDGRWLISVDGSQSALSARPAGAIDGLGRISELPAFVQAGLPVICDGGHPVYMPHLGQIREGPKITAIFCR